MTTTEANPRPTPAQLIQLLLKGGWSQSEIAVELSSTQPTVSRICSGRHKNPGYSLVQRLTDLVNQRENFKKLRPQ